MLCSHAQPDKQVSATVKNISFVVKETTQGVKRKLCGKTFAQEVFFILHSSPVKEKNGILNLQRMDPSAFQGERATSPFSED
jgi:hypothetical protein